MYLTRTIKEEIFRQFSKILKIYFQATYTSEVSFDRAH